MLRVFVSLWLFFFTVCSGDSTGSTMTVWAILTRKHPRVTPNLRASLTTTSNPSTRRTAGGHPFDDCSPRPPRVRPLSVPHEKLLFRIFTLDYNPVSHSYLRWNRFNCCSIFGKCENPHFIVLCTCTVMHVTNTYFEPCLLNFERRIKNTIMISAEHSLWCSVTVSSWLASQCCKYISKPRVGFQLTH